ncbi:DoxX family protein [Corynebacterium ureicelerivorans]
MRPLEKLLVPLFAGAGVLHFAKPQPFDGIVPDALPGSAHTYTYVSGVAELAAAALLANPKTRAAGGKFAAALLAAVWPANFNMAWQWRDKPLPLKAIAIGRLPLQIPLIQAALRIGRR